MPENQDTMEADQHLTPQPHSQPDLIDKIRDVFNILVRTTLIASKVDKPWEIEPEMKITVNRLAVELSQWIVDGLS
jgi:hypothetical protein